MYQLCEKRSLINSSVAGALCCQPPPDLTGVFPIFLSRRAFFFFSEYKLCCYSQNVHSLPFCLFGFRVYTVEKIYYFILSISKQSSFSDVSFSSINKPDSALSFCAGIYVEWFVELKTASAFLFVFLVKCFPPVCVFVAVKLLTKTICSLEE